MVENVLVVVAALAAIVWVNWYFFIAGREPARAEPAGDSVVTGVNGTVITVDGGYSPATIRVRAGAPAVLVFDRKDNSSCSEEVVFPDFSIRRYLPQGKRTTIELPAMSPGRYEFMCGMSMLRGTLIVEER